MLNQDLQGHMAGTDEKISRLQEQIERLVVGLNRRSNAKYKESFYGEGSESKYKENVSPGSNGRGLFKDPQHAAFERQKILHDTVKEEEEYRIPGLYINHYSDNQSLKHLKLSLPVFEGCHRAFNEQLQEVQQQLLWYRDKSNKRFQDLEDLVEVAAQQMEILNKKKIQQRGLGTLKNPFVEAKATGSQSLEPVPHLKLHFPSCRGDNQQLDYKYDTEMFTTKSSLMVAKEELAAFYEGAPKFDEDPSDKEDWHCEELICKALGLEDSFKAKQNFEGNFTDAKGLECTSTFKSDDEEDLEVQTQLESQMSKDLTTFIQMEELRLQQPIPCSHSSCLDKKSCKFSREKVLIFDPGGSMQGSWSKSVMNRVMNQQHDSHQDCLSSEHHVVSLGPGESNHSCLDEEAALSLKCEVVRTDPMQVPVANGNHLTSKHECADLKWMVGEHEFQTTNRTLPLESHDLVLGVDWLGSLGPVTFDFKNLLLQFKQEGQVVTLKGNVAPGKPRLQQMSVKEFVRSCERQENGFSEGIKRMFKNMISIERVKFVKVALINLACGQPGQWQGHSEFVDQIVKSVIHSKVSNESDKIVNIHHVDSVKTGIIVLPYKYQYRGLEQGRPEMKEPRSPEYHQASKKSVTIYVFDPGGRKWSSEDQP